MRRINLIHNQLSYITTNDKKDPLKNWRDMLSFDKKELEEIYFPPGKELRDKIFNIMKDSNIFKNHYYKTELSSSDAKNLIEEQIKVILNGLGNFVEIRKDIYKFFYFQESLLLYDSGFAVKFAANSILYYGCLLNLSTEKHKEYISRAQTFEDYGCFALTEFGHGSNTRGLLTTSTYDKETGEFLLNSPSIESYKWWIGNSSRFANTAVVFAQLYTNGKSNGIHPFIINIRDKKTMKELPGIMIGDCGPKIGLHNVDNGFLVFNNFRIPKSSLLDKYCNVDDNGNYTSIISCPDKRFATMISVLVEGRVFIAACCQTLIVNALTIAGRYAAVRTQFGEKVECPILNYQTTQVRILPALADHFAFRFAGQDLVKRLIEASVK
jgi:acyl-CoA oxidase